jgi:arginyl-tRNA synthetase
MGKQTISELLVGQLQQSAKQLLNESGTQWPEGLTVKIERPAHPEHGDYSTNLSMLLAKAMRQSPVHIAGRLKAILERNGSMNGLLARIEVAPPGFLNVFADWQTWADEYAVLPPVANKASTGPGQKQKVLVEHTSINPNKSAHIGHLRNSCIGDALARMFAFAGYKVEVHNYIDDLGNQLADTVVGMMHTSSDGDYARFGDYCWDTYAKVNKAYKDNPPLLEERTRVLHALEAGGSNTAWIGALAAERIVREQVSEMLQFGIGYDVLVWESRIVREGLWQSAFEMLKTTGSFRLVEEGKLKGCWVLKQHDDSEDKEEDAAFQADKVLVRSNGILTYTAKDIAYHLWKFGLLDRGFSYAKFQDKLWSTVPDGVSRKFGHADLVVNVIDHRQEYPQAMVKLALETLGFKEQAERLHHVSYGVVSLSPETAAGLGVDISDGRSSYPMSGRQGIGVKVSELLEQMERVIEQGRSRRTGLSSRAIAAAAIRYYLLKYQLQTEVVFDLHKAMEVSGNSGVYLLYSFARAGSILSKAGGNAPTSGVQLPDDTEPQEFALMRQLAYWPETFEAAMRQLSPTFICTYAFELAGEFNNFYNTCPVLKGPEDRIAYRLWLTSAFKETLHRILLVLGMPTPKRM